MDLVLKEFLLRVLPIMLSPPPTNFHLKTNNAIGLLTLLLQEFNIILSFSCCNPMQYTVYCRCNLVQTLCHVYHHFLSHLKATDFTQILVQSLIQMI